MENLFRNYLKNESTPDEIKQVLLLVQTPEGRACFDQLLQNIELEQNNNLPTTETSKHIWQRITALALQESNLTDERKPASGRTLPMWSLRFGRVAAVVLPLLLAGWWYFTRSVEMLHSTHYGQTKSIGLPDGSVVVLNGNSSLKYESKWANYAARQVWLTGEAYFKVTHQANHQRFLVHTRRNYTIEVLGTEFNVNDRQNTTKVVLQSGKIKLTVEQKAAVKSLTMQPGQLVEIDTTLRQMKLNTVKPELFTSWRQQKLVFEGTRFADITTMLRETYNLDVIVADPRLLEEKITGTVPSGNVNELLTALAISLQLKYKQDNNQVKFY